MAGQSVGDAHQVAIVTGATSGIGLAAATALADHGFALALLGRSDDRLAAAAATVRARASAPVTTYRCDFARLAEVRKAAEQLRADLDHIDVLANNAGGTLGSVHRKTIDGFEETIQTNHLGPFLLTVLLRDRLAGGRVINTSSTVHPRGRVDPTDFTGGPNPRVGLAAYANAKQANILFTVEATRRWPDVVSAAYHPGVVRTHFGAQNPIFAFFWRFAPSVLVRSPEQGAETLVWLATQPREAVRPGAYYHDRRLLQPAPNATDPALAATLWDASLKATGLV